MAFALIAQALALAPVGPQPAQAQSTATTLVSNTGQTADNYITIYQNFAATSFTTGSNAGGYTLTSVEFVAKRALNATQTAKAVFQLWSGTTSGGPNEKVADLTAPSTIPESTVSLTPSTATTLKASTTYYVVMGSTSGNEFQLDDFRPSRTASDSEDTGGATGWSIGDSYWYGGGNDPDSLSSSSWTEDGAEYGTPVLQIAVKGTAVNSSTPVSNLNQGAENPRSTVGSTTIYATSFTVGGVGYTLSSVDLVMPERSATQAGVTRVELWSAASTGAPDSKLASLTGPNSWSAGTVSFTAPASTTLTANATYHVVGYTTNDSQSFGASSTDSNAEDSGGAAGWSIGDNIWHKSGSDPSSAAAWEEPDPDIYTEALRFAVKGAAAGSTPTQSDDATLSALTASGSTDGTTFSALTGADALVPTFDAATAGYRATVGDDTTHVKLTPTVNESNATVKVGKAGTTLAAVDSATASDPISLDVGDNEITVEVTAQDGTTKEYTVTVRRVPSGTRWHATLVPESREASGNTFVGCVDAATCLASMTLQEFTIGAANTVTKAELRTDNNSFEVHFDNLPHLSLQGLKFCAGGTAFTIISSRLLTATSALGWTANVPVSLSIGTSCTAAMQASDATLSALAASGSTDGTSFSALIEADALRPTFSVAVTGYRATVGNDTTHVKLTPTVSASNATVKVGKADTTLAGVTSGSASDAIALDVGDNEITVEVTAQNGTTKQEYTVTVRRVPSGTEWHATLNPQSFSGSTGCEDAQSGVGDKCSATETLSEDEFSIGGTSYGVYGVRLTSSTLAFFLDSNDPTFSDLSLCVGDSSFAFGDATIDTTLDSATWSPVTLSLSVGTLVSVTIGTSCTQVTTQPTITLTSSAGDSVAESVGSVTITATLSETATSNVTVSLARQGASTATATSDYTLAGSITVTSGTTAGTATLSVVNDSVVEADETLVLEATAGGYTAG
ncbi:MAG: cadherin-like beta sandwich domain-containing protein, partial [Acidimicrobiaceae bacterium]|nr:cadherin-like beta sandwich domain-containing protein [Acidimicrobiaceae bacterium]